jgi:hypothetical protein
MMVPKEVYVAMTKAGVAWADANLTWMLLDDQTKPMLAAITIEARNVDGVDSMSEATQIALSSSTYRDHLKDTAHAKREALVSKVYYDGCKSLFDAQRTVEASHRAAGAAAP